MRVTVFLTLLVASILAAFAFRTRTPRAPR
jgi:hypothetical protein